MLYANGDKFIGYYMVGIKDGQGEYTLPNGDRYKGDFLNDNINGKGEFYYANGDVYVGEYQRRAFPRAR
jgi:hypothetical protein